MTLINEFESRASKEISSSNQLAELYAILAAITYKNDRAISRLPYEMQRDKI